MTDHGFDSGATSEFALDGTEHAALLPGDKDAVWVGCVMAAVSLTWEVSGQGYVFFSLA